MLQQESKRRRSLDSQQPIARASFRLRRRDTNVVLEATARLDRKLDIWFGEAAETGRPPRRSKLAAEAVTAAAVETSETDTPNGVLVDASQISESSSDSGSGGYTVGRKAWRLLSSVSARKSDDLCWLLPRTVAQRISRRTWHVMSRSGGDLDEDDRCTGTQGENWRARVMCIAPYLKTLWDTVGVFLLATDTVLVPISLAWESCWKSLFTVLAEVSLVFWTLDMACSFFAPYEVDGKHVRACRRTACHYMKRTFVLDLAVVGLDWMTVLLTFTNGADKVPASAFKVVRFSKISRLLRAVARLNGNRYQQTAKFAMVQAQKAGLEGLLSFMSATGKYFVSLLLLVHYGACLWYYLIRTEDEAEEAWTSIMREQIGEQNVGEDPSKLGWWYFTGVYFTVVALISCSSWLSPSNKPEMALALTLHLIGWIFSSLIVSALSAWFVDMKAGLFARRQAQETLQDYLRQHSVEPWLAIEIRSQVLKQAGVKTHICLEDVKALASVSPTLKKSLVLQSYGKNVASERIIRALHALSDDLLVRLCSYDGVFDVRSQSAGQVLFLSGEECCVAFHVVWGQVSYAGIDAQSSDAACGEESSTSFDDRQGCALEPGDWLSEVSLWVHCRTQGIAETVSHCELLILDAPALWDVLAGIPELLHIAEDCSNALAHVLRNLGPACLSDVKSHGTAEVVARTASRMSPETRRQLSVHVLDALKGSSVNVVELAEEARTYKCSLFFDGATPYRVVFLAVVELRMGEKRLAQVGHFKDGEQFRAASPVPVATKVRGHESLEGAAKRIKADKFPTLDIELVVGSDTFKQGNSASGVSTFYWKQTFTAEVAECDASTWADQRGYGIVGGDPSHRIPILSRPQAKTILTKQHQKNKEHRREQEDAFAWLSDGEWLSLEDIQQFKFVEASESFTSNVLPLVSDATHIQLAQFVSVYA